MRTAFVLQKLEESIRYTEIAGLEDVEKGIEFFWKFEILPVRNLKLVE